MTKSNIEKKTELLLKKYGLFKAPVDVVKLAGKLGVIIELKNLDDNVSGFLVKKEDKSVIGVNQNHHEVRQRFTIAHEVGHFTLHSETPLFVDDYKGSILYRANNKSQDHKREREANMFAAALLMPNALISDELKKIPYDLTYENKLSLISNTFKVSQQAMDYRLKALGYYEYGF
jgi:Zn-dependent peptidase ImmA (M78 family)